MKLIAAAQPLCLALHLHHRYLHCLVLLTSTQFHTSTGERIELHRNSTSSAVTVLFLRLELAAHLFISQYKFTPLLLRWKA
jgi:hypothetical protein